MTDDPEPIPSTVLIQLHDSRDPELLGSGRMPEALLAERMPKLCEALNSIARELQESLRRPQAHSGDFALSEIDLKMSLAVGMASKFIIVQGTASGSIEVTFKWTK